MTTDQRIENLEKGLASARCRRRWLPTCAAGCLGMIFAWGFFTQPGRLGTALAEGPAKATTPAIGQPQAALNAKVPEKVATKDASSESVQLLMKKAEGGDVVAMYRLGVALREGILAKRDDAQAEKWLKTAAEKGNAEAMYELSRLYVELNQQPNDGLYAKQADYWRHEAEKLGHHETVVDAAAKMALNDPKKGFEMMKAAALKGYVEAYDLLASYYEKGIGCEKNQGEALRLRILGADAGNAYCLVSLGQVQTEAHNYSAAFKYYQRAASLGEVIAMVKLVECYEKGIGVQKDEVAAKVWLEKISAEGRRSYQNANYLYMLGRLELRGGDKTDEAKVFRNRSRSGG